MSTADETPSGGPIRTEFIRLSERKALQLKLWKAGPSKFNDGILPAMVEIEEISYPDDGSPPKYGPAVRIPSKAEGFMLISYLEDFLKDARKLNREERKKLTARSTTDDFS